MRGALGAMRAALEEMGVEQRAPAPATPRGGHARGRGPAPLTDRIAHGRVASARTRAPSSSAAASWAAARRIIWPVSAGATSSCSSAAQLSGGTTWHAAGLVGQLRSHANMTQLIRYSTELYSVAGGGDGAGDGLDALREPLGGAHRRTADPAQAHGLDGAGLRRGGSGDRPRRGQAPVAAHAHRRSRRRRVAPRRRQGESGRRDRGARQGRARGRRQDLREGQGHRRQDRGRGRRRRHDQRGRHRVRGGGQLRRALGARGRPARGRHRAASSRRAHVHRDQALRRRAPRPARDARPRRPHLLQGGSGRARHGRVRAGGQALALAGLPGGFHLHACCRRTGRSSRSSCRTPSSACPRSSTRRSSA